MTKIKIIFIILIVTLTSFFVFWYRSYNNKQEKSYSSAEIQAKKLADNPNRIRLLATGDFIAHVSVKSYSFADIFKCRNIGDAFDIVK